MTSTISTTLTSAVTPGNGGAYGLGVTITSTGAIESTAGDALYLTYASASVINSGTILDTGSISSPNGAYLNSSVTLLNEGYIGGPTGAKDFGGGLVNFGTINGAGGAGYGVRLNNIHGFGTALGNSGRITGGETGAYAYGQSYLLNNATGTITGGSGFGVKIGGASLNNEGLISATGTAGVALNGGNGINSGIITGGTIGAYIKNGGNFTNSGNIHGGQTGALLDNSGTDHLINTGSIGGATFGVDLAYSGTVTNAGTLTGGTDALYAKHNAYLTVDAGAVFNGNVVDHANGGQLILGGNTNGSLDIDSFTGFKFITFGTATWTLEGTASQLANSETISGMGHGDSLLLDNFAATAVSYIANTGLVLTNASGTATIHVTGGFSPGSVAFTTAGGATDISAPCFATGTRILTTAGEIPVEDIAIGDELVTVREDGPLTARVIWTGRRHVNLATHPEPDLVRPIRITAGAFAPGIPARDLRVSPNHAIYWDGHLFEAAALVNNITIFQETTPRAITYHHIELEAHDIILAEGLPTESYLDTGNRRMFDSEPGPTTLHPNFYPGPLDATACTHLIRHGEPLDTLRTHLATRIRANAA